MEQHDILLNTATGLEWVTGIFSDCLQNAIALAVESAGKATYVGHKSFRVESGQWVEVAQ